MPADEVLVLKAIRSLGIDVPVLKSEVKNGVVILHLYGGGVAQWREHDEVKKVMEVAQALQADIDKLIPPGKVEQKKKKK